MRIYIAGGMTGKPQFNIPLFDRVALVLRAQGYDVVSPAELDSPEMRKLGLASPDGALAPLEQGTGETWGHVLARDVKLIADGGIEGIVFVEPDWYKSRGARLEATVGLLCDLKFGLYSAASIGSVTTVQRDWVQSQITSGFVEQWRKRT